MILFLLLTSEIKVDPGFNSGYLKPDMNTLRYSYMPGEALVFADLFEPLIVFSLTFIIF